MYRFSMALMSPKSALECVGGDLGLISEPTVGPRPKKSQAFREGILRQSRARGKPGQRRRLSTKLFELFVTLAIVAVLAALLIPSADHDQSYHYTPPPSNEGVEFASLAGEYRLGSHRGRGWCLSILPDGRYSLLHSGCGGVSNRESGSVKRIGEYLVLSASEATNESRMTRVVRPVNWDCRTYLVPAEKLPELIEAIVKGDEPRIGRGKFYVKNLDDAVTGVPELPPEWAERLRHRVVIGTVVEMLDGGRAKLDRGSADGIIAGTKLNIQRRDRYHNNRKLKIVAVEPRSCTVQHFCPNEFQVPLELGCKVLAERDAQSAPAR